uniref:FMN-binding protein n=1 Tax=Lachnospira eligens TaxID=39485 RepID=UPI0040285572
MLLIISLIIVALFIYFLKDSLKKYANIFYIGAAVISIAVFLLEFLPMHLFVKNNILGIFAKGSLGTAMFVVVMYTGALPKGNKLIAPLMKIRGELSITAAILVLCHNFTYGMTYFRMLFTKTSLLSATQLAAAVISLVLIAIMIVLTVTSFPSVRKKMQAKKWKQLQRTAYVFYGLMYVHIMLINIPYARLGLGMYIANVVIYSIVFLGYAAMRIAKAVSVKAARAGKTYGKKPETVLYGLALVICAVMTVSCFAGRQTVSASEDNEEWNDFFNEETVATMVKEIESSTAKTDADGTTQESLEESASSDGQSDSQAGGAGNEVSVNSNNSGSDNASGNSSGNSSDSGNQSAQPDNGYDSGNQSAQPDNSSDNSGELSGGSGSDAPANTTFKADGTYKGSAVCETYNYNVTVTIVISGDTITSVTAESEAGAQDVQYFNMANAKVPAQLLANQSTSGVDAVSGATKSSNAIKKAFYYAYKSAKNAHVR